MNEKQDLVIVRDGLPGDRNFILATWLRGLYYGDSWFSLIPKQLFMQNYHAFLERLLATPDLKIKVACLKNDPEVILGYSIWRTVRNAVVLDWIFVKAAWRRIGIGKMLYPAQTAWVTHLTKVGKALKPSSVHFNPFLL